MWATPVRRKKYIIINKYVNQTLKSNLHWLKATFSKLFGTILFLHYIAKTESFVEVQKQPVKIGIAALSSEKYIFP